MHLYERKVSRERESLSQPSQRSVRMYEKKMTLFPETTASVRACSDLSKIALAYTLIVSL